MARVFFDVPKILAALIVIVTGWRLPYMICLGASHENLPFYQDSITSYLETANFHGSIFIL